MQHGDEALEHVLAVQARLLGAGEQLAVEGEVDLREDEHEHQAEDEDQDQRQTYEIEIGISDRPTR